MQENNVNKGQWKVGPEKINKKKILSQFFPKFLFSYFTPEELTNTPFLCQLAIGEVSTLLILSSLHFSTVMDLHFFSSFFFWCKEQNCILFLLMKGKVGRRLPVWSCCQDVKNLTQLNDRNKIIVLRHILNTYFQVQEKILNQTTTFITEGLGEWKGWEHLQEKDILSAAHKADTNPYWAVSFILHCTVFGNVIFAIK